MEPCPGCARKQAGSSHERTISVTDPLKDQAETESRGPGQEDTLMDTRSFLLVTVAVAAGVLLYVNPAVGLAVIGAITALATLTQLIRR
jgi:Flp pilus assembly protein TadB